MGFEVPTREPSELRAGTTWAWRREDLDDWPADVWTLSYEFRNETQFFTITATADGLDHVVSVDAATTAAYVAGNYFWYAYVTDGSQTYNIETAAMAVLADVTAAAASDGRTFAQKLLDACEAILQNRGTQGDIDLLSSTVGPRASVRDRDALWQLRNQLKNEVAAEQVAADIKAGKPAKNRIQTRFV